MPPEQTGELSPCAWCGELAVSRVEITPPVFTSIGGVRRLKVRATEVDVCAEHGAMVQRNKAEREAVAQAKRAALAQARADKKAARSQRHA